MKQTTNNNFSRHGWRCFTAKAVGFRWSLRSKLPCLLTAGTLLVSIALFTSCDNGNGKTDPKCECAVKVQPFGSPCACPVAGTSACNCIEEEEPQNQTATLTNLFNEGYTATVQEWCVGVRHPNRLVYLSEWVR